MENKIITLTNDFTKDKVIINVKEISSMRGFGKYTHVWTKNMQKSDTPYIVSESIDEINRLINPFPYLP